ncbi:GPI-anchored surface protein, putative, partial [Bodo saltans]
KTRLLKAHHSTFVQHRNIFLLSHRSLSHSRFTLTFYYTPPLLAVSWTHTYVVAISLFRCALDSLQQKKLALLCFPPAKRKVKRFYLKQRPQHFRVETTDTPFLTHSLFVYPRFNFFFTSPYSRSLHLPDVIRALWVLHVKNKKTPHTHIRTFPAPFCVVVAAFIFATSDDTRFLCFRAPFFFEVFVVCGIHNDACFCVRGRECSTTLFSLFFLLVIYFCLAIWSYDFCAP